MFSEYMLNYIMAYKMMSNIVVVNDHNYLKLQPTLSLLTTMKGITTITT